MDVYNAIIKRRTIFMSDATENAEHFPSNVRNAKHSVVVNEYTRILRSKFRSIRRFQQKQILININDISRETAKRDLVELVRKNVLRKIGKWRNGYYELNKMGHKWLINGSMRQKRGASLIINSNLLFSVNPEMFEEKYVCKEKGCLL